MPPRKTTSQFKIAAILINGHKMYDYSESEYSGRRVALTIICPIHGSFTQTPNSHLAGGGCPACAGNVKLTRDEFISKAIAIHSGRYSYDLVDYKSTNKQVVITCGVHGNFNQRPNDHIMGKGCSACAGNGKKNTAGFISRARKIHGLTYGYENVNYTNKTSKVWITCNKHGDFKQSPTNHLAGNGCKECGRIATTQKRRLSIGEFIKNATVTHGGKYDYSLSSYVNSASSILIKCPDHGIFKQSANSHMRGAGCPYCANRDITSSYINLVKDAICDVAVKFGIAKNPKIRAKRQSSKMSFDLQHVGAWIYPDSESCKEAELECKRTLETGVLTKREMPDGYTETTYAYNVEKIIEIYEKHGGVRV